MTPYYSEPGIAIYHGDARAVLPEIGGGLGSFFLTSPPYDNARTYGLLTPDDLESIGLEAIRILKPGGVAMWVIDGPVNDGARSTTPFEMVCRWSRLVGWRFLECLIFNRMGAPGEFAGRFRKDHEYAPVFVRDGAVHVCNKRPLAIRSIYGTRKDSASTRKRDGEMSTRVASGWAVENGMTLPGTVWSYGSVGKRLDPSSSTGHPATFPEALARDAITCFSEPGDLVIDPCVGSGTTLRAAKDLGRRAIGIEIEERYCEIAANRLRQGVLAFEVPS